MRSFERLHDADVEHGADSFKGDDAVWMDRTEGRTLLQNPVPGKHKFPISKRFGRGMSSVIQPRSKVNVAVRPDKLDADLASDPALLFLDQRHGATHVGVY